MWSTWDFTESNILIVPFLLPQPNILLFPLGIFSFSTNIRQGQCHSQCWNVAVIFQADVNLFDNTVNHKITPFPESWYKCSLMCVFSFENNARTNVFLLEIQYYFFAHIQVHGNPRRSKSTDWGFAACSHKSLHSHLLCELERIQKDVLQAELLLMEHGVPLG